MSELITTVEIDGEVVGRGSTRAYEVTAEIATDLTKQLTDLTAIAPPRINDDVQAAIQATMRISERANRVASEARRRERLGSDAPLDEALAEADFAEGKSFSDRGTTDEDG